MKILIISSQFYPMIGGVPEMTQNYAKVFSDFGNEVKLIVGNNYTKEYFYKKNIKVFIKPNFIEKNNLFNWADIIFKVHVSLRLAPFRPKHLKKTIVSIHNFLMSKDLNINYFITKIKINYLKTVAKIFYVSHFLRKKNNLKGNVIYNFYDSNNFYNKKKIRNKKIIYVGNLLESKGIHLLLKAVALIKDKLNFSDVSIVGDGYKKKELKALSRQLKIDQYIRFYPGTKNKKKINNFYNNHKIHVVPSINEPFGVVVLEGLACGCINISSRSGGLIEAAGECGTFFKSNNYHDLANVLLKRLSQKHHYNKIKLLRKLNRHKIENVGKKLINIFKETIVS
jgi:glycogen(starch) synthase